jgi:hypothetical protein
MPDLAVVSGTHVTAKPVSPPALQSIRAGTLQATRVLFQQGKNPLYTLTNPCVLINF